MSKRRTVLTVAVTRLDSGEVTVEICTADGYPVASQSWAPFFEADSGLLGTVSAIVTDLEEEMSFMAQIQCLAGPSDEPAIRVAKKVTTKVKGRGP